MSDKFDRSMPPVKMAYITNLYPLLSETFIVAEAKRLNEAGFNVRVFSLFKPQATENDLDDPELKTQTVYCTPLMRLRKVVPAHLYFIFKSPTAYVKTFRYAFRHRNRKASLWSLLRRPMNGVEQRRKLAYADRQNILLHFFVVTPFARLMLREGYTWMHAAFANIPSSFALLTFQLTGVPYSISAHAMDIFIRPELLPEKFSDARFVVTCNHYNKSWLQQRYANIDFDKVHPIYHGIDLNRFSGADRTQAAQPPVLLAVGRLVRKKGLGVLLRACLALKEKNIPFQLWIVGDGPERPRLEMFCRMNHLHQMVKFWGACPPLQIADFYRKASIFVLPCVQDENGDQDGIPNVIAEAMAMRLPIVSSQISAIPELVADTVSGRLLAPNDPDNLAAVLQELLQDRALAARMGDQGRERVEKVFDAVQTTNELVALFKQHLPTEPALSDSH